MSEWLEAGLEDDMRQRMFATASAGRPFALATIAAADGGPRPAGAQMVITEGDAWGFLSGGCIEEDVAIHARQVLAEGSPRRLVYGRGSPFIDMRLPCGGRLDVLVERVSPDDPSLEALREFTLSRQPVVWESNGVERCCRPVDRPAEPLAGAFARCVFLPPHRLIVVGADPFALAIAALGTRMAWETLLLAPFGPAGPPPFGISCDRRGAATALGDVAPDAWTAIVVATHDLEADERVLVPALRSSAFYVGVLGSRRRLPERLAGLSRAGLSDAEVARLRAPVGLPIRARSPWEIAVAVAGDIIAVANSASLQPSQAEQSADDAAH